MVTERQIDLLVELRLVGFTGIEALARRPLLADLDVALLAGALEELEAEGLVRRRSGRFPGWMLSQTGRERVVSAAQADMAHAGEAIGAAYRRFIGLNPALLEICTRWQSIEGPDGDLVPNRHDDIELDRATIGALASLHGAAAPMLADLDRAGPRFRSYRIRLENALDRVDRGEHDWFTRPTVDSYHSVWFEIHEHLLLMLGRTRAQERAANAAPAPSATE